MVVVQWSGWAEEPSGVGAVDVSARKERSSVFEIHACKQDGSTLRAFAVGDSEEVIIGRDDNCDITIASRSVSREHCSVERDGEQMVLRDLSSTGGTYVEGERVTNVQVSDGMKVQVGPAVLKFFEA